MCVETAKHSPFNIRKVPTLACGQCGMTLVYTMTVKTRGSWLICIPAGLFCVLNHFNLINVVLYNSVCQNRMLEVVINSIINRAINYNCELHKRYVYTDCQYEFSLQQSAARRAPTLHDYVLLSVLGVR